VQPPSYAAEFEKKLAKQVEDRVIDDGLSDDEGGPVDEDDVQMIDAEDGDDV